MPVTQHVPKEDNGDAPKQVAQGCGQMAGSYIRPPRYYGRPLAVKKLTVTPVLVSSATRHAWYMTTNIGRRNCSKKKSCMLARFRERASRKSPCIDNILCPFVLVLTLCCLPFVDIIRIMICTSHLCLPCLLLAVIRILSRLDSSTPRTPVSTPLAFVVSSLRLGIGSLLTDPPPPTHT